MTTSSTTKVLIVDDNVFNREGMRLYLLREGFHVLEAGDAEATKRIVREYRPDVTVLDIVIPLKSHGRARLSESVGVALVSELRKIHPTMGIVLFSAYEDRGGGVFELVRKGVRGIAYKLKGCAPHELLQAIQEVMAGQVVIDAEVTQKDALAQDLLRQLTADERQWILNAMERMHELTQREWEVAQRVAASHTTAGIAAALMLKSKTVEGHISRVYNKLGLDAIDEYAPHLRKVILLAKAFMISDLQLGKSS